MPKKKGGKKGAKIVDGLATSEMTRDQLVGHVRRIQMELEREREERNFFMLEREKLFALWNIAMEQLHAQKLKTQLAVEQMTEHDEEKQMEVLVHKQKLRHLLTEQSKRVDQARLQNLKKLSKAQEDMLSIQKIMKESIDQKSKELRQSQSAICDLVRQMKMDNARNVSKMRNDMCIEISQLERDFLRSSKESENRIEVSIEHERELVKNKHLDHIERMKAIHAEEMDKMQTHFHTVTINNLAVIAALQEEIKEMKEHEKTIIEELRKSKKDFKALEKAIMEENEKRRKVEDKDGKAKENIQKELRKMRQITETKDRYSRKMEVANEALIQKVTLVEDETRIFRRTLTKAILDMQQESIMKRLVLEMKLKAVSKTQKTVVDSAGITKPGVK